MYDAKHWLLGQNCGKESPVCFKMISSVSLVGVWEWVKRFEFFNFLFEQLNSPSLRIGMENFDTVKHRCIPSRFTVLKIKIYRKRNNTFLSPDI